MLNVIMVSVTFFIILPNVIMLNVIMLCVVAPPQGPMLLKKFLRNFIDGPNKLDCLSLLSCLMFVVVRSIL